MILHAIINFPQIKVVLAIKNFNAAKSYDEKNETQYWNNTKISSLLRHMLSISDLIFDRKCLPCETKKKKF